jgi:hypothetical protein
MTKEETVPEMYRRVLTAKELIEKMFDGPIPMDNVIKAEKKVPGVSLQILTADDRAKTFDRYFAYVLITRSCKAKFGSLINCKRLERPTTSWTVNT